MNRGVLGIFLCLFVMQSVQVATYGQETDPRHRFLLGPGDQLEVSVWKDEALSRQLVVTPDGTISFPLIGDVMAKGRTVSELRTDIQSRIKEYVPDAPVNVMVLKVGSPKVYVVGKVTKPGVFVMEEPVRVMQVLSMAGGMNAFAKKDDIIIIRSEGDGQKIFPFNYSKVSEGKALEQNIHVQPGDTVVVP